MNTRVFNVTHVRYIRHLLIVPILLSDYQARLRRNIPNQLNSGFFAYMSWWHYGMALLSALLPLFAWKPRVSGGLSAQRSYKTKIFYSFNKLFNKELKLLEISDAMAPCEVNLIIHNLRYTAIWTAGVHYWVIFTNAGYCQLISLAPHVYA